jgi:hypothetical protein
VLGHITGCRGHIEYLPSLRHTGFGVRQQGMTTIALRWQSTRCGFSEAAKFVCEPHQDWIG